MSNERSINRNASRLSAQELDELLSDSSLPDSIREYFCSRSDRGGILNTRAVVAGNGQASGEHVIDSIETKRPRTNIDENHKPPGAPSGIHQRRRKKIQW